MLLALGEDCLPCKPRSVDLDSLQGLQVYVNNASLGGKPVLPPSPYAWVLMERRKLQCTAKPRKPSSPAHPERADSEPETMDQITPQASTRENEKSGNRLARNCRSCRRAASVDDSCDARYVHAGDRNREAQCAGPVVALLFRGKTQETGSAWTRLYRVYLFCVLVCLRQKRNVSYTLLDFESRGDGLEPSASAVTGNRGRVSQQLARSRGLPNTA